MNEVLVGGNEVLLASLRKLQLVVVKSMSDHGFGRGFSHLGAATSVGLGVGFIICP